MFDVPAKAHPMLCTISTDMAQERIGGASPPLARGHGQEKVHVFSIANQKGGVGKTTTSVNLASALAEHGASVLVIDLDPQANTTTGLGIDAKTGATIYEALAGDTGLCQVIQPTATEGLWLCPTNVHLSGAEAELPKLERREYKLRDALDQGTAEWAMRTGNAFDYVLIDCPPSLGFLTLNALVASTGVLAPLQCEYFALEGLSHLVQTIEWVRRGFNPDLVLRGLLLTMYDRRNRLSDMVVSDVRGHFGERVFKTVVPRNVRLSEAPSHGLSVLHYDPSCKGAIAYRELAAEILEQDQESVLHADWS